MRTHFSPVDTFSEIDHVTFAAQNEFYLTGFSAKQVIRVFSVTILKISS